ncbi:colicin transporter [Erwinia billingiae]|uniref:colicin transporter n=1 Tax=Erwinia billingiae TaxID=182337 RepID=UPI000CFF9EB7|nr:colicin transporter [Erwinia billingiae]PRB57939.1 colicin transporter [Erwinia billingiae]
MAGQNFEPHVLYDTGADFFELNGNSTMKFTPKGAKELCEEATKRNIFIGRIECGNWSVSGFCPDGNMTWDSKSDLVAAGKIKENNDLAIENINEDASEGYNAFLFTLPY